jgi:hypothetical protein
MMVTTCYNVSLHSSSFSSLMKLFTLLLLLFINIIILLRNRQATIQLDLCKSTQLDLKFVSVVEIVIHKFVVWTTFKLKCGWKIELWNSICLRNKIFKLLKHACMPYVCKIIAYGKFFWLTATFYHVYTFIYTGIGKKYVCSTSSSLYLFVCYKE